jgi:pimeloyl-ACP methyl ester carboxylesterase
MKADVNAAVRLGPGQSSHERLALTEHYVPVTERSLCVCSWGTPGKPVVMLLHGLQSHAGLWDQLGVAIASRGYHVLAPDRRGHGRSGWFDTYNMLDYVADIRSLLAHVGVGPVVLAGHCESTILASLFAAAHPALVRRLVLLQFPDLSRRVPAETRARCISLYLQKSAEATAAHPVFDNPEAALERLLRDAPFQVPRLMAGKVTPRNIKPVEGGFTWRWDPRILTFRLLFDLIDVDIVAETLKRVDTELLLIFGQQSSLVTNREGKILDFARRLVPAGKQTLVPGGHYPHMEETLPEALVGAFV